VDSDISLKFGLHRVHHPSWIRRDDSIAAILWQLRRCGLVYV